MTWNSSVDVEIIYFPSLILCTSIRMVAHKGKIESCLNHIVPTMIRSSRPRLYSRSYYYALHTYRKYRLNPQHHEDEFIYIVNKSSDKETPIRGILCNMPKQLTEP